MNIRHASRTLTLCSVLTVLAPAGCSSDPNEACTDCTLDAGLDAATSAPAKTTSKDSGFVALRPIPDGGYPDGQAPDYDLPLQAQIQINGEHLPCGACSVLAVQAQGGRRPYTYAWSDPTLQGPGPHTVCPSAPTSYSVTLTDSSGTHGEVTIDPKTVQASAQLDCVVDSGVPLDQVGCESHSSYDAPDPNADIVGCEMSPDGGMLTDHGFVSVNESSGKIPAPLIPGHAYEWSYDHIIPLVLGEGVVVEVYGAFDEQPCQKEDLLFSFKLDGTWHQSVCFTPQKAYTRSITRVEVEGVWFWFDLGQIGTLCKSCSDG